MATTPTTFTVDTSAALGLRIRALEDRLEHLQAPAAAVDRPPLPHEIARPRHLVPEGDAERADIQRMHASFDAELTVRIARCARAQARWCQRVLAAARRPWLTVVAAFARSPRPVPSKPALKVVVR